MLAAKLPLLHQLEDRSQSSSCHHQVASSDQTGEGVEVGCPWFRRGVVGVAFLGLFFAPPGGVFQTERGGGGGGGGRGWGGGGGGVAEASSCLRM